MGAILNIVLLNLKILLAFMETWKYNGACSLK